jgi:UDP-N-acetyl-2-amino-2-deoxyglucuronate dehydrogenase
MGGGNLMMRTSSTLGVGIIGSGFMGKTYAETVARQVRGVRLAGIAGGTRAPALAEKYGVPCFDSYRDLVARSDIDIVCVATPHARHADHALAAARAGKHLVIDKPMAHSVEACDAILDACESHQLKCSVTFTMRNRIGFVKAKEAIDSGRLGRVLEIRTYQVVPNGLKAVPAWQLLPENLGLLFGHGVHNIDAVRALTGREIRSVFAKCRTLTGVPVEATSDVLLTTDDGTAHYIFCSFELAKPGFPRAESGIRIACEKGLLDVDTYNETRISVDGADWQTLAVQPPIDWASKGFLDPVRLQTYRDLLQDLVDAIIEGRPPKVTGWDGRQAVAAALAAYESSRTGNEIFLS